MCKRFPSRWWKDERLTTLAISLPLRDDAWALLRRLNSAKRSLELTAGAMESGELGLENSSGIFSCFSRLFLVRQKANGDVERETLHTPDQVGLSAN